MIRSGRRCEIVPLKELLQPWIMEIKNDEHEPHTIHDLIVDIPGGSTGASGPEGVPLQYTLAQNPGKHEPVRSTSDV